MFRVSIKFMEYPTVTGKVNGDPQICTLLAVSKVALVIR